MAAVVLLAGLAAGGVLGCVDSSTQGAGARADRNATRSEVAPREFSPAGDTNSTPRDMPGAGRGSRESTKGKW